MNDVDESIDVANENENDLTNNLLNSLRVKAADALNDDELFDDRHRHYSKQMMNVFFKIFN